MPVYFDKDKKRWRFTFNRKIDNARHRATKLLPKGWSRGQAEAYDRSHSGSLYAQATGLEKPRLSLAGAVELYIDHHIPGLRTAKKIAQDLAHLVDEIESSHLDEVADLANRYELAHRTTLAPATIHNRLAYLKAAVRYAYRKHHYGDRDYTDRMTLPKVSNGRQVYAKHPALEALWAAFDDPEARALFRIAYYCGLRWRAELLPRQPGDVEKVGRDVWLNLGLTKNGSPRMKWVHPAARADLAYLPFTRGDSAFYAAFWKAREAVGMEDFKPHDQRHSLASHILSGGNTLADVQEALHQDSAVSAKRYAHLYRERLKSVLKGLPGQKNAHPGKGGRPKPAKKVA